MNRDKEKKKSYAYPKQGVINVIKNAVYKNCILADVQELKNDSRYDGRSDCARKIVAFHLNKLNYNYKTIMFNEWGIDPATSEKLLASAKVDIYRAKKMFGSELGDKLGRFVTIFNLCTNYINSNYYDRLED